MHSKRAQQAINSAVHGGHDGCASKLQKVNRLVGSCGDGAQAAGSRWHTAALLCFGRAAALAAREALQVAPHMIGCQGNADKHQQRHSSHANASTRPGSCG